MTKLHSRAQRAMRRPLAVAASLVLVGTGLTPGIAMAHGTIHDARTHYGKTIWGPSILYCDGDYERADIYPGQETGVDLLTFECT